MKSNKNFSNIFSKYKTYNPEVEGYGSTQEWRSKFNERMSPDEAAQVIADNDPLKIMGFNKSPANQVELKRQYRKLMLVHHPDRGGDVDKARQIIAAYTLLQERMK